MDKKKEIDKWRRRKEKMLEYRASGWTLQRIADHYHISRTRIHQILGCTKRGTS